MKIIPIASDSMGVRSMATYVETSDIKMMIDPSAALGPLRYGLPPHRLEEEALSSSLQEIKRYGKKCKIFVISHYHFDHFSYDMEFLQGELYIKDTRSFINRSQKERAQEFKKSKKDFFYADGKEIIKGSTRIKFSKPFPHGPEGTKLGYVIMTVIEEDKKFIHASDVQGPVTTEATEYILKEEPDIVYIDGPPTYLGLRFGTKNVERAKKNLLKIADIAETVILDHHSQRDLGIRKRLKEVYEVGNVVSAAEYAKKEEINLEARRRELYKSNSFAERRS